VERGQFNLHTGPPAPNFGVLFTTESVLTASFWLQCSDVVPPGFLPFSYCMCACVCVVLKLLPNVNENFCS